MLSAQSTLLVDTKGQSEKMNSYLHGVARNHYKGYTTTNWAEQRYDDKLALYNGIQNNFANGGKKIYRIGHNISDGNADYNVNGHLRHHGGWHWATQYGDGVSEEYIAIATNLGNSFFGTPNVPNTTLRLGAGTRRYCYRHVIPNDPDKTDDDNNLYSGFAVTINYQNSIDLDFDLLPKSRSITGINVPVGDFTCEVKSAIFGVANMSPCDDPNFNVIQVGGPEAGTLLKPGNYELNFRITRDNSDDVAYWGMIISVNHPDNLGVLVRLNPDELITIDADPSLFPSGTSALVRHSIVHSVVNTKYSPSSFGIDMNEVYTPSSTNEGLELAELDYLYGYDDLELMLEDVKALDIGGLSIVANISTGYPEETAGMAEYLSELGQNVEIIELGSELMGDWNKGKFTLCNTPNQAALTTIPFARAIKNNNNPNVSRVKVATTSSYNFMLDFIESQGQGFAGNGDIQRIVEEWIAPYGMGLLDYITIHDYPDYTTNAAYDPNTGSNLFVQKRYAGPGDYCFDADCNPATTPGEPCFFDCANQTPGTPIMVGVLHTPQGKVRQIPAAHTLFQNEVVGGIRRALTSLGLEDEIGVIVTEVGLVAESDGFDMDGNPIQQEKAVNTFAEALWFTESFMVAARSQFDAHIPFALLKELSGPVSVPLLCNDPSASGTTFADDQAFNMNFYQNTNDAGVTYDEIFVKPVFKARKMIFENLGTLVIPIDGDDNPQNDPVRIESPPLFDPAPRVYGRTVETSMLNTLVTMDEKGEFAYILITNSNPDDAQGSLPLRIEIDGASITEGEIMLFDADRPYDRQLNYTTGNGTFSDYNCSSPHAFNISQPVYNQAVYDDGFQIPNLSICILKVALDEPTPIICSADPVATGRSCDAIDVSWTVPTGGNNTLTNQAIYYYEAVDGQGTAPTTFNPADKNWKFYANADLACTQMSIVGLLYPQDEYQIAVVSSFQSTGSTIGPGRQEVVCFTTGATTYCEDRIDVSYIETDFLADGNGTIQNPNATCLADLFDYDEVAFCRPQTADISPSQACTSTAGALEFDLSNELRVEALRVFAGAVNGTLNVYFDTDLDLPGFDNQNEPIQLDLLEEGEWYTGAFPCGGVENVQRIRIEQSVQGEMLRKVILYGAPIDPGADEPMPKCCGSSDAIALTGLLYDAVQSGSLDADISQNKEIFISDNFTINQNYTFSDCQIYMDDNAKITIPEDIDVVFLNSEIQGCDRMWQGIFKYGITGDVTFSNSEIMDAETAIKVESYNNNGSVGSSFIKIFNSKFIQNRNAFNLGSNGYCDTKFEVIGVLIDGTEFNLKPSSVFSGNRMAFSGIYSDYSAEPITISHSSFVNLDDFIRIANTQNEVLLSNNQIDGVNRDSDFGIFLAQNFNNNVQQCTIKNVKTGIRNVYSKNSIIHANLIHDVRIGIDNLGYYTFKNDHTITFNDITANDIGVLSSDCPSYSILGNTITNDYSQASISIKSAITPFRYSKTGIISSEFAPRVGTLNQNILQNTIGTAFLDPSVISAGVILDNTNDGVIEKNDIFLQSTNLAGQSNLEYYGVFKQRGERNLICGNDITGLYGFDRGIGSIMSPGRTQCNKIEFTRQAMYIEGDNESPNSISGNLMANMQTGIHVNSTGLTAMLGSQNHQANRWQQNWSNGAIWEGVATFIPFSQFRINPNHGLDFWPTAPINPSDDWFVQNFIATVPFYDACLDESGLLINTCHNNPQVEPPTEPCYGEGCLGTLARNADLLNEPYRSMVERRAMEEILETYPSGDFPTELVPYMEEYSNSEFANFLQLEAFLDNPLVGSTGIQIEVESLNERIQELRPELLTHYEWLATLDKGDLVAYYEVNDEPIEFEEMRDLYNDLAQYQESIEQAEESHWEEAYLMNQQLSIESEFGVLEQQVNEIYLRNKLSADHVLSEADVQAIEQIATLCPQEWGEAVFKARTLWLQNGFGIDGRWEDCNTGGESFKLEQHEGVMKKEEEGSVNAFFAYPVPVENQFILSIPIEYIGGTYSVYNTLGVKIANGDLSEQDQILNAADYYNGIHFVHIKKDNLRPKTISVAIQKL